MTSQKSYNPGNLVRLARNFIFGIKPLSLPEELKARHSQLRDGKDFESILYRKYYNSSPDLSILRRSYNWTDHVSGRLERARQQIVPWVSSYVKLAGTTVFEIGCGTGSSTVAFAEQGAFVLASDVHEASLEVARARLKGHGLSAQCILHDGMPDGAPDVILMYAVLEHMTLQERLAAISAAWTSLKPGGFIVVVETPNRLWFDDQHTSLENFFHWLPDDLALKYAASTSRAEFNEIVTPTQLVRHGRGVSFHDFEVAMGVSASELPVVSCLTEWIRQQTKSHRVESNVLRRRYERILQEIRPDLHQGFCLEYLDLLLKKSS